MVFFMMACDRNGSEQHPNGGRVEYKVSSDKKGFVVTYNIADPPYDHKKEEKVDDLVWKDSHVGDEGAPVYLSVESKKDSAKITARIDFKHNLLNDSTVRGDSVVITLRDTLPDN